MNLRGAERETLADLLTVSNTQNTASLTLGLVYRHQLKHATLLVTHAPDSQNDSYAF